LGWVVYWRICHRGHLESIKSPKDLTKEQLQQAEWLIQIEIAAKFPFGKDGFEGHYEAVLRKKMPAHVREWVAEFFREYEGGKHRFLVKACRGATKSTVFTILMSTYVLAKFPTEGVLIIQEGDSAGIKTAKAVAGIIKDNQGFKLAYPTIVPDEDKAWGAEGYEIKDTSRPYEEFRQDVLKERPKDSSFIGVGWASSKVVGMHPAWLFLDDIHDPENTRSQIEMESVKSTLKSNILQTLNRPPGMKEANVVVSYTPWDKNDAYAFLESTGLYYQITSPITVPPRKKDAFEYRGKQVSLLWRGIKDPIQYLHDKEVEFGPIGFATQCLLDLTAAEGKNLKIEWLHKYEVAKLDPSWPVYFGVDYASTIDKVKDKDRDFFTIAFFRIVPGMGAVIYDGFRDKVSRVEAKDRLISFADIHHPVLAGVDKLGKGEEFFVDLLTSGLPVSPVPRQGGKSLSKGEKFEDVLAKLFFNSQLWIGDIDTPFIKHFKDEWVAWDGTQRSHDDTLDAAYSGAYIIQGKLIVPKFNSRLKPVEKQPDPYAALAHAY
jgi:hypothetical protein